MVAEKSEPREFSSPPCFAHEFEDKLTNSETVDVLMELLEAARAGTRIAKEIRIQVKKLGEASVLLDLIDQIHRDEVFHCSMLGRAIESLGGKPSTEIGALYEKSMSIGDPGGRLAVLNRGQGWVSRKINQLVPQLRDTQLIEFLKKMRRTHDLNIEKTNIALER